MTNIKPNQSNKLKYIILIIVAIVIAVPIYFVLSFSKQVADNNARADKVWRFRLDELSGLTILDNKITEAKANPPNHDAIDGIGGNYDSIYSAADFQASGSLDQISQQVAKNLAKSSYLPMGGISISKMGLIDDAIQSYKNNDNIVLVKYFIKNSICKGNNCRTGKWDMVNPTNQQMSNSEIKNVRVELYSEPYYNSMSKYSFKDYVSISN